MDWGSESTWLVETYSVSQKQSKATNLSVPAAKLFSLYSVILKSAFENDNQNP